jgi:hypothetical protein
MHTSAWNAEGPAYLPCIRAVGLGKASYRVGALGVGAAGVRALRALVDVVACLQQKLMLCIGTHIIKVYLNFRDGGKKSWH